MRIALLEDDVSLGQLISAWLEDEGYECELFENGESLLAAIQEGSYDILMLDWVLPGMSGAEVLDWVRDNQGWNTPVLFVTQKDSQEDIVSALKRGADDYMVKPVQRAELIARIEALARRLQPASRTVKNIEVGPYRLDMETRTLFCTGDAVTLTQKEFELSAFFFKHAGEILERNRIMETVWATSAELKTRTVDIHISRLRKKLGLNGEHGWRLVGIYNHGYRLEKAFQTEAHVNDSA